jgi:class 3 adenylate cyclase
MKAYQQTCGAVIEKYEGHVAQYLGDGLMVYFGWPHASVMLARIWQNLGRNDDAYALLAPCHARFTEGFGTRDL